VATVVGVDSSTQSVKVELRDFESGQVLAVGRAPHTLTTPPLSEQDPHEWWRALTLALSRAGADRQSLTGEPSSVGLSDVVAMSVAGQQHGMVLLDATGEPIRAAKLWNDTESSPQADALVHRWGAANWATKVGSVPVAAFTISKLAWIAEYEPWTLDRVAHVLLPHDYLTWRLTGQPVTDRGDASGTGYWSPSEGRWCLEALHLVSASVDWASALPLVLAPWESAGQITSAAAAELGLPPDVIIGPGSGDNMAAALGLGLASGEVAVSIGTSGTVYARGAAPTADPSGSVAGFADATGEFLPLVCTLNATKVTEAVRRLLGVGFEQLDDLALACPAGARGLTMLPYLDGERTPNRPGATGALTGIRSDVARDQLARAAFEGVICGLLDGLDALGAAGVNAAGRLHLVGGGAKSAAYRRCLADLSGREVIVSDAEEHVATGAALQAAMVMAKESTPSTTLSSVADQWGLGAGSVTEPQQIDAAMIRSAYAQLRDAMAS
jgi:xylulokinase